MKYYMLLITALAVPSVLDYSYAQSLAVGESPFERSYGDVKFLDAYFGTEDQKIEVEPGDSNVPLTVVLANVGTHDITGIQSQLLLPIGFSGSGPGSVIRADSSSNPLAGEIFYLTFSVNLDKNLQIRQYPASMEVDYSRLRESGTRVMFAEFDFRITGGSVINAHADQPFLTPLRTNDVSIQITNDGTAQISGVDISTDTPAFQNNLENVVIPVSNWNVGQIEPGSSESIDLTVYVPESIKDQTLKIPLSISYYNSHGDPQQISRVVDFYVKGFVDLNIFNVNVVDLSAGQLIVGEIINEGNEDGLFGFISVEPRGDSNLRPVEQFIDEIETDSPVPFNAPIEFDGSPQYGEHEITIHVRYKDSLRDETVVSHDAVVSIPEPPAEEEETMPDMILIMIIPIAVAIGVGVYLAKSRKKKITP